MHYDVEKSIALKLSNTLNTLRKTFNKAIAEYNISSEQYAFLKLISDKDLTPSQIANILNKDKAAITRFINAVEKKGLIKKERINKRSYKISITKKGKELLEKIDKKAVYFREKIESDISHDKIECLFEVLNKIEKIMEGLK
jgi:DNA-binding MarR family transcriptional regulator